MFRWNMCHFKLPCFCSTLNLVATDIKRVKFITVGITSITKANVITTDTIVLNLVTIGINELNHLAIILIG